MDSASDLDAAANALQMAVGTVLYGGSWELSKNRKGRSPYLQDPHVRPSIVREREGGGYHP